MFFTHSLVIVLLFMLVLFSMFAAVECGNTQINKQTNFLKYTPNMYIILKKHITSMFIQTHNPEKIK